MCIPESKQVPVFLNAIGATTYSVLRDLLAPETPISRSFADIVDALKRHFALVVAERYDFHKRDQRPGQTIALYVAELRRLASKCAFAGYLEEALRDRFVCGLQSEPIQRKLLSEAALTFAKAVETATNMEAAVANTQAMKTHSLPVDQVQTPPQVPPTPPNLAHKNMVSREGAPPQTRQAYHSGPESTPGGSTTHTESDCGCKTLVCHNCGKRGHIARVCRSGRGSRRPRGRGRGRTLWLNTPTQPQEDDQVWDVLTVAPQSIVSPYKVTLLINNKHLCMEIDTGAGVRNYLQDPFSWCIPVKTNHQTPHLHSRTHCRPGTAAGACQVQGLPRFA